MSQDRFRPDRGFVNPSRLQRGPNGRPLCRQCGTETKPPRRTFCSAYCVDAWRMTTDAQYVRRAVWARDRGVCQQCGLDTEKLSSALLALYDDDPRAAELNAKLLGFKLHVTSHYWGGLKCRSLWEADHIVSVVDGGGTCTLANMQSLCQACHKAKTSELAARRARARKAARSAV